MKKIFDKPIIMYVRISDKCNSGCFMCKFAKGSGTFNISMDKYVKLLDKMKNENSYKIIRFTGGEPLLHPDIIKFINKAKEYGFLTSIITNGFLMPSKYKGLIDNGLDQVIFSLDGDTAYLHDQLRNFPNCFNHIMESLFLIKKYNPKINLRVNTVVSKYNIENLKNILDILQEKHVDSWSIIPIRTSNDGWNDGNEQKYVKCYKDFIEYTKDIKKIKFLGYSQFWGGRNEFEIHNLFYNNIFYGPTKKCNLINMVRFYVPDVNEIVPCNCASHRIQQIAVDLTDIDDMDKRTIIMANWLAVNGPNNCKGCEPLNAFISDKGYDIKNIFEI